MIKSVKGGNTGKARGCHNLEKGTGRVRGHWGKGGRRMKLCSRFRPWKLKENETDAL